MEEVKKNLKVYFDKREDFAKVISKDDPNYLREMLEMELAKASFAIGYMEENDKVNKKEALQIVSDILQGKF